MALLAHLYTHIRGSQEDIATLSLQYILSQSQELSLAFTQHLSDSLNKEIRRELHFICQSVGEKLERPDMSGLDQAGREIVICEAKFYAGLTSNQPNAYLERLRRNDGIGLVFICPTARKLTLWAKLLELAHTKSDSFHADVDGVGMSIITWAEVTEVLYRIASVYAVDLLPDISQLDGFCKQMDSDAFIPFSPEDMGPIKARLEERYYQVIDAVIDELRVDKSLDGSLKGLKATANRKGYVRGIYLNNAALTISYDRDLWMNPSLCDTPFWVAVRDTEWKQPERILTKIAKYPDREKAWYWNMWYLALHPLQGETLDAIAKDMKLQILDYVSDILTEQ